MTTSTQCMRCRHFYGMTNCDAYPEDPIPEEIVLGRHDHAEPFKGDHGILFDPTKEPL